MSELMVRFPCEHGKWFRHPIDLKAVRWKWCDGGTTRFLCSAGKNTMGQWMWMEVDPLEVDSG